MRPFVSRFAVCATLVFAVVGAASADVWYLRAPKDKESFYNKGLVTNLAYWAQSEGGAVGSGAPSKTDELVVHKKRQLRIGTKNTTTTCKSLTLGDGTSGNYGQLTHDNGSHTYSNDGLFLKGYSQYMSNVADATMKVLGKVTILSTVSDPCAFHQQQEKYTNATLQVDAAVSGEVGTGFVIGPTSSSWSCSTNNTFKFTDLANYRGSIEIRAGRYQEITEKYFGEKAVLSTFTTAGALSVSTPGCILETVSATDVLTAGTVSLSAGSQLSVTFDGNGGCSKVVATDTLTVGEGVRINLVDLEKVAEAGRYTILQGPLGCGLQTSAFTLVGAPKWLGATLAVDKTATTESLVLVLEKGWVRLVRSDKTGKDFLDGQSAMTNKNSWSDGKLPHAGAIYEIPASRTLRTPRESNFPKWDFPGAGIVLGGQNSSMTLFGQGIAIHGPYIVPEGTMGRLWTGQGVSKKDVPVTATSIVVDGLLKMGAYNTSTLILDGPLSGSGEVVMEGVDSTGAYEGLYEFTDNSAFTGRLRLSLSATMIEKGNETNQTWDVFRETDFGGARPAFDARGVTLEHGANLDINPPTTTNNYYAYTSPTNCGLLVTESANLALPYARSSLTWLAPLTLNGTLRKTGSAGLALASPMKFLTAGGELTDTPTEGKNVIAWEGGALKALDCDAFNGAQVRLTAASQNGWVKLQLDVDYANADLTRYGIRNTKTDNPFAIVNPSAFPKLPLEVTFPAEHPDAREFSVGIMTVSAAAATDVGALIPVDQLPRKIYRGYRQTAETIPNADGSLTFGIRFERTGLVLVVR